MGSGADEAMTGRTPDEVVGDSAFESWWSSERKRYRGRMEHTVWRRKARLWLAWCAGRRETEARIAELEVKNAELKRRLIITETMNARALEMAENRGYHNGLLAGLA